MWSTPEDRDQAERRARMTKKRSPAQEKRRAQRETAFNEGFDACTQIYASKMSFPLKVDLTNQLYVDQRRAAYAAWEYEEDRE